MTYSRTHKHFANWIDDQKALKEPQNFLGSNYRTVLNFWKWLDRFSSVQFNGVACRHSILDYKKRNKYDGIMYSGGDFRAPSAAYAAFKYEGVNVGFAVGYATYELIHMHTLLERGETLIFVPLFDGL